MGIDWLVGNLWPAPAPNHTLLDFYMFSPHTLDDLEAANQHGTDIIPNEWKRVFDCTKHQVNLLLAIILNSYCKHECNTE